LEFNNQHNLHQQSLLVSRETFSSRSSCFLEPNICLNDLMKLDKRFSLPVVKCCVNNDEAVPPAPSSLQFDEDTVSENFLREKLLILNSIWDFFYRKKSFLPITTEPRRSSQKETRQSARGEFLVRL